MAESGRESTTPVSHVRRNGAASCESDEMVAKRSGRSEKFVVTNPERVLYRAGKFTKAEVIDYYLRVAPVLLPHLKGRPATLKRYPDGVHGEFFYEKDAPAFTPSWVKTFPVPRREGGKDIDYIVINDARTLAWVANISSLEIHPFLHGIPQLERPTMIVFDLDPGEGADLLTCLRSHRCCERCSTNWRQRPSQKNRSSSRKCVSRNGRPTVYCVTPRFSACARTNLRTR